MRIKGLALKNIVLKFEVGGGGQEVNSERESQITSRLKTVFSDFHTVVFRCMKLFCPNSTKQKVRLPLEIWCLCRLHIVRTTNFLNLLTLRRATSEISRRPSRGRGKILLEFTDSRKNVSLITNSRKCWSSILGNCFTVRTPTQSIIHSSTHSQTQCHGQTRNFWVTKIWFCSFWYHFLPIFCPCWATKAHQRPCGTALSQIFKVIQFGKMALWSIFGHKTP